MLYESITKNKKERKKKMKKFLSILLMLAMLATLMIAPVSVSAANPWKVVMNKDFSTADQLATGGVKGGTAGFIDNTGGFVYDAENGCLKKTNATRWDYSLGKNYSAPNVVRYSFDVKLDATANYYFNAMSAEWDASSVAFTFDKDFGGDSLKRNEWQKYTIEFIPSATAGQQKAKLWRGDESYYSSAKEVTYSYANNRTAVTWLRFEQKAAPTTEVLFDNFKIEMFMFLPEVKSVSFFDNLGNEITDFEDMTPAVSMVKANIANAASLDAILENFWIFNETTEEEVELGDATYENDIFTAELPNGLQGGCNYSINVDMALANANGETGDGACITFNTVFADMKAELKAMSNETFEADKWKTQWAKNFDTSADFTLDGEYQKKAGFVQVPDLPSGFVAMEYDAENQCLKTQATGTPEFSVHVPVQYDSASSAIVAMPDRVRYSFDVKLPEANGLEAAGDFYVQMYGLKVTTNSTFRLSEFGGEAVKRNEWQRYTMEIIPNNQKNAEQHVKLWRGDESFYASAVDKVYPYKDTNYNYTHWIRVIRRAENVSGTDNVYFDNFKLERRRYIFTSDFSQGTYNLVSQTLEPSGTPGFMTLGATVANDQRLMVDASHGNNEIMRVWLAGLYTNARPVKFSFDLKTDDENLINLLIRFGAQTADVSGNYVINGDKNVGGATFHPGAWQRYNFVIVPAASAGGNHTVTAWRGGESDRATAIETSFVMAGNRTNISNISLINGVAADATYYIDNVVAERFFNDGFEVTKPEITGVKATIDNSSAISGNYWLVLAGYNGNVFEKISIKPMELSATNSLLTETIEIPEDMEGCAEIKAYLWDNKTLEPLTGFIEVR